MKLRKVGVLTLLFAVVAGGCAVILSVEQRVKESNQDLARIHRGIAEHRQELHMLKAEWQNLNHPDRIRDLADQLLDLEPPTAMQVSGDFFAPSSGFMLSQGAARDRDEGVIYENKPYVASAR